MIAFALLLAAPAAAQAQPAQQSVKVEPRPAALALARVLNGEEHIVGDAASDAKAVALMDQLRQGNAELTAMEKEHPGILRAIAEAMMPIVNRSARERLPVLWRRQALLYGDTFNDAELGTLATFYGSPTGQKLLRTVMASVKPDAMLAEMKASEDFKVTPGAVQKDIQAAVPAVVAQMDTSDQMTLMMFGRSGLLERIQAMAPRTQAIALTWYDEAAPWEEAETENAIAAVMKRFGVDAE